MPTGFLRQKWILALPAGCIVGFIVSGYAIPRERPRPIGTGRLVMAEQSLEFTATSDGKAVGGDTDQSSMKHFRGHMTFQLQNNGTSPVRLQLPLARVEAVGDTSLADVELDHPASKGSRQVELIPPRDSYTLVAPYAFLAMSPPADRRFIFSFDRPDNDTTGEFLVGGFESEPVVWRLAEEANDK
jgi:hypothetical protein